MYDVAHDSLTKFAFSFFLKEGKFGYSILCFSIQVFTLEDRHENGDEQENKV